MVKEVVKKTVTETIGEDGSTKTVIKKHSPKIIDKKSPNISSNLKSNSGVKKKMTAREREELLIENFVGLQHAMTNMSIKFGTLSDNLSQLLRIFEEAAKNFASGKKTDDKDMLKKIDSLLDQNKTIAKGLVLMEGKLRGRADEPTMEPRVETSHIRPRPLPSI